MCEPVLRIRLAVQCGALDVDGLIAGIEVDVADGRSIACDRACDVYFAKEWWDDEVYILGLSGEVSARKRGMAYLACLRKETHHGKRRKTRHGSAVVIARDSYYRVVELCWNIEVYYLR